MGDKKKKNKEIEIEVKVFKDKEKEKKTAPVNIKQPAVQDNNDVIDKILKGKVGSMPMVAKREEAAPPVPKKSKPKVKSEKIKEKPVKVKKAKKERKEKKPLSQEARTFIMYISVVVFILFIFVGWIFSLKYNFNIINQNTPESKNNFGDFRKTWEKDWDEVNGVFEEGILSIEQRLEKESVLLETVEKELIKEVVVEDVKNKIEQDLENKEDELNKEEEEINNN